MKRNSTNTQLTTIWVLITAFIISSCGDSSTEVEPFVPVVGNSNFNLVINELNAGGDPVDWVEIYNPGTEMVQLEGFFIFDDHLDKYQIPSGFAIEPGAYLRFLCDGLATGNHTNFRLAGGGEQIVLEDPDQNVIDFVEYPELREGQFYGRFPDGATAFFISGIQTPDTSNGDNPGPVLQSLDRLPLVGAQNTPFDITVLGFHQQGQISGVTLFYRINDEDYAEVAMTAITDSTFTGVIPQFITDGTVDFYVTASDQAGLTTNRPFWAPDTVETFIINSDPLPGLVINEFLAANDANLADPDAVEEEFDDWIEIYNTGSEAIDIGGFHLSDNPEDPFRHQLPTDQPSVTTIQPGGYLLLWADGSSEQGALHLDFGLSAAGETIGLYYFDGRTIDEYQFGEQTSDVSMGRSPDGSNNWVAMPNPTPGASNGQQ
ncbi:MAG: lamin tail domain-containing protein [Cyclobacteriaceae bacterium]